jgi:hypothetical protein
MAYTLPKIFEISALARLRKLDRIAAPARTSRSHLSKLPLDHIIGNKVKRAYPRDPLIEKRRSVMER